MILTDIEKRKCSNLQKYNEKLLKTIHYIFTDKKTLDHFKKVEAELAKIDDDFMEELHEKDDYLVLYQELLWIPSFTDQEQYEQASLILMNNKLKDCSFYLHYDRSTFNNVLKKVLAQFFIGFGDTTELYTKNIELEQLAENEKVYANALDSIVRIFKD